jgi:hypothetical protein
MAGLAAERKLSDWAFFYTTCTILYTMLARVTETASYAGNIGDYDGCTTQTA